MLTTGQAVRHEPVRGQNVGARVRGAFGRHERTLSNAYRRFFVDLDGFADRIEGWAPRPANILEIGCGEGAMAERLTSRYPEADYLGIDVSAQTGRLYQGRAAGVSFERVTAQALADRKPGGFDLVVMADVLHHVPQAERDQVMAAMATLTAVGGVAVFKDWRRSPSFRHFLCWSSDRYLTGDANVRYMDEAELRRRVTRAFGPDALFAEAPIGPTAHNYAFALRRRKA